MFAVKRLNASKSSHNMYCTFLFNTIEQANEQYKLELSWGDEVSIVEMEETDDNPIIYCLKNRYNGLIDIHPFFYDEYQCDKEILRDQFMQEEYDGSSTYYVKVGMCEKPDEWVTQQIKALIYK